jgi:excisionase family DNA binding protein
MAINVDEDKPILISVAAASQLAGVSRALGYELCAGGVWPTVRFGRAVRVHREGLLRWIDQQAGLAPADSNGGRGES